MILSKKENVVQLSDITAILFDIGDTLIDASGLMDRALKNSAEHLYLKKLIKDPLEFISTYRRIDKITHGPGINHMFSDLEIIKKTWNALGLDYSPKSFGTFLGIYRDFIRNSIKRNEKLMNLFEWLKNSGYGIGIITDGSTTEQIEQMFRLGILEYVDVLVTSEEVGIEKPNKRIFDFAISQFKVKPIKLAMVGDDIERDIKGAKSVGMVAILVTQYARKNHTRDIIEPDIIMKTVFDIRKYLAGGESG